MDNTKILIVEDEVLIGYELEDILKNAGYTVVGIAYDFESAIAVLKKEQPDLVLLDINLNGVEEGFEIASYIKENLSIPYLFISSYTDKKTLAIASKFKPSSYITKPFSKAQIATTIQMVLAQIEQDTIEATIIVNNGSKKEKIVVQDILWIQADGVYIEIHTRTKKIALRDSLTSFLNEHSFESIRKIHRSYAVNFENIDSINKGHISINRTRIPIAKQYQEVVNDAFLK